MEWNLWMLNLSLRVRVEMWLGRPGRSQTKGRVESGVNYGQGNMWPSLRFTGDVDLNRQAMEWWHCVANRRVHRKALRVPWEMLAEERPHLGRLPARSALAPNLQKNRRVARDGLRQLGGLSRYGVHRQWV